MDNHESDLLQTFIEETIDNIKIVEEGLLELEESPENIQIIDEVFRAMHSIKGGAGLVGLEKVNQLTHHLEFLLEDIRSNEKTLSEELFDILFTGLDIMKNMIDNNDFENSDLSESINQLIDIIKKYDKNISNEAVEIVNKVESSGEKYLKIEMNLNMDFFENGTDPLMLLLELTQYGSIIKTDLKYENLPLLNDLEPLKLYINWTIYLQTEESIKEIENIFIFVSDENNIKIKDISENTDAWFNLDKKTGEMLMDKGLISEEELNSALNEQNRIGEILVKNNVVKKDEIDDVLNLQKKFRNIRQKQTIRVNSKRLEKILDDIGELLIAQSRIKEITTGLPGLERSQKSEINNSFQDIDKIIRRIQEQVMSASMIPIAGTFSGIKRMIRDLGKKEKKEINVEIKGSETELDRKIIEQIADPLKHLVRNAVDHGLETPEERVEKGKSLEGTVRLNAFHQEGNVVIEVSDDGYGIDPEKVRKKAVDKGIIDANRQLSKNDIYKLIFKPGFSTSEEISDVSGRGVGLDVVETNLKELHGRIEVESSIGEGTTFRIKLPLTLAIIDGIIVKVGDDNFVIPLSSIIEFLDAVKHNFDCVEGKGIIVNIRDEYIPYIPLYKILKSNSKYKNSGEGILVILKDGDKRLALQVDEIVEQEQVVIKNVRENMGKADGVAGATILGNGNVSLILDVPTLFKKAKKL